MNLKNININHYGNNQQNTFQERDKWKEADSDQNLSFKTTKAKTEKQYLHQSLLFQKR